MDQRRDIIELSPDRPEQFRPERWAAARERERLGGRHWEKITDVYIALLFASVLGAFTAGMVSVVGYLLQSPVEMQRSGYSALISTESLVGAVGVLLMAFIGRVTCVLGPAAVDRAQAAWWLRLPVLVAPFIRRGVHGRLLLGGVLGAIAWLPVAAGLIQSGALPGGTGLADVLLGALVSGCLVWFTMGVCAVVQTFGGRRLLGRVLAVVPAVVATLLLLEAAARATGLLGEGAPGWWAWSPAVLPLAAMGTGPVTSSVTMLAMVGAVSVTLWADSRWERVEHRDLIEAGNASAHLGGAMVMLNVRELGAVLSAPGDRAVRTRPRWLTRIRGPLSPTWSWALADAVVLLRAPRTFTRVLTAWAVVAVVAVSEVGQQTVVLAVAVACSGVMAVRSLTAAADEVAGMGLLQRLLPLGRTAAWRAHTLAPAAVLLPWGLATGVTVATVSFPAGDPSSWMTIAVGAVCGWALSASVVRTATQPPLDWGTVMQAAQTGRTFGPVATSLMHGTDTALLTILPLALTAVLTMVPVAYLLVTVVVAMVAWFVAVSVADR